MEIRKVLKFKWSIFKKIKEKSEKRKALEKIENSCAKDLEIFN